VVGSGSAEEMELRGRVVVITGASMGIGEDLARLLAKEGCKLVLVARSEAVEEVAKSCGAAALRGDVTDRKTHAEAIKMAVNEFGRLDVYINNAGRGISRHVMDLEESDLYDMMSVNVTSALYGMQEAVKQFKRQDGCRGQIINVSSMLGRLPLASVRSAYSASKHALQALTASLRIDLTSEGFKDIHVCTVLPGPVATDFGLNSKYGGVDNRNIPNAQPVHEVSQVIAETIRTPVAEAFTRPIYRDWVARYYTAEDVAALESAMAIVPSNPK